MSPRTLQRKLAEANTTYLELLDDTRKDLALRYIEDPRRSMTDITFSLGSRSQARSLARSSAGRGSVLATIGQAARRGRRARTSAWRGRSSSFSRPRP